MDIPQRDTKVPIFSDNLVDENLQLDEAAIADLSIPDPSGSPIVTN